MAYICDDSLATAMTAYEKARSMEKLSRTSRGGTRATCCGMRARSTFAVTPSCEGMAKRVGQADSNRLAELTLSFDLEASALLALENGGRFLPN